MRMLDTMDAVVIDRSQLRAHPSVVGKLCRALASQRVAIIAPEAGRIMISPRPPGLRWATPQPGGQDWVFSGLARGSFAISEDADRVTVSYRFFQSRIFWIGSAGAAAVGALIALDSAEPRAILLCILFWWITFALVRLSQRSRVSRWLRAVLTSDGFPPVPPLQDPGP